MNSRGVFGDAAARRWLPENPVVRRVPAMLTHFAGLRDLERGIAFVRTDWSEAVFGGCIRAGTRCAAVAGRTQYLEIIAPDPKQKRNGCDAAYIAKLQSRAG